MTLVDITYTTRDGKSKQESVSSDSTSLSLCGKEIVEIDLAPLQNCKSLVELDLSANWLKRIDLISISSLEHLEILKLGSNG
ncbi:MAG: hypothetical protein KAJ96_04765, partial [Candidatus Thorarchaeota archaeon]|nr:hypothetical protein [Candidatus Thorarchaeota archaeon]